MLWDLRSQTSRSQLRLVPSLEHCTRGKEREGRKLGPFKLVPNNHTSRKCPQKECKSPSIIPAMTHTGWAFCPSAPWAQEFCSPQQTWVLTSHFSHSIPFLCLLNPQEPGKPCGMWPTFQTWLGVSHASSFSEQDFSSIKNRPPPTDSVPQPNSSFNPLKLMLCIFWVIWGLCGNVFLQRE